MKVGFNNTNIFASLFRSIAFNCITYQLYCRGLHSRLKAPVYSEKIQVTCGKFHLVYHKEGLLFISGLGSIATKWRLSTKKLTASNRKP